MRRATAGAVTEQGSKALGRPGPWNLKTISLVPGAAGDPVKVDNAVTHGWVAGASPAVTVTTVTVTAWTPSQTTGPPALAAPRALQYINIQP